jgi:hypothetical protein
MRETRMLEFSLGPQRPVRRPSQCNALGVDGIRTVQLPYAPVPRPFGQYLLVVTRVMSRTFTISGVLTALAFAGLSAACTPGGVGDPCTPEDEYLPGFSGFSVEEVNVESRSFQCETRICLVNHFQGRVSCPYGNKLSTTVMQNIAINPADTPPDCIIPGDPNTKIEAPVDPQIIKREAAKAVYCSCRCDGPDANARYCECPSGFSCTKLVEKFGFEKGGQLAGSYCIKEATDYRKGEVVVTNTCRKSQDNCGAVDENGIPKQ